MTQRQAVMPDVELERAVVYQRECRHTDMSDSEDTPIVSSALLLK